MKSERVTRAVALPASVTAIARLVYMASQTLSGVETSNTESSDLLKEVRNDLAYAVAALREIADEHTFVGLEPWPHCLAESEK